MTTEPAAATPAAPADKRSSRGFILGVLLVGALPFAPVSTRARDSDALAKAAQNPVADRISLPFQNNTFFGVGPHGDVANVLNIQPVVPISAESYQQNDKGPAQCR